MLEVDRLGDGAVLQVRLIDGLEVGEAGVRAPHRHDYHELIWVRDGDGVQEIDGAPVPVRPGSVTVIGRGQVHRFLRAFSLRGGIVRFGDEALAGGAERIAAGWLLAGRGGLVVPVPAGEAERVGGVFEALAAEVRRPPDAVAADLQRHLLSVLLLWLERWHDDARGERPEVEDAEVRLFRRFAERLEVDFGRHHDAAHYADALGVPGAALSRALASLTGRTTKDLILDRVMLEAARLLRFTDLSVGEVAHRAGYGDQLYFSRAFKRRHGQAPQAYRAAVRGR